MKLGCWMLSVVIGIWSVPLLAAEVSAQVDRNVITQNETVELTLELSDQDGTPDLAPLEDDFTVLNNARSNRISIVNGRVDTRNEWVLTLAPKRSGELHIPALAVGDKHTDPIVVKVIAGKAATARNDVILESSVDVRSVDVQAQLIYTLRLLHGVDLKEGALSVPDLPNAIVERLGEDSTSEVQRGGRRYRVVERKYAIFPQKSGPFKIPPAEFNGKTVARGSSPFDSFFNRRFGADPFDQVFGSGQVVRARSDEIVVNVSAQPKETLGSWWLPAKNIKRSDEWAPNPPQFRVGEPVTRTLVLEADGLTAQQLPDIGQADIAGVKLYPDQPAKETTAHATGVTAKKTLKIALIATRPGKLQLPPVEVSWWDTRLRSRQVATLPERVIDVSPAADATGANAPAVASTPLPVVNTPLRNAADAAVSFDDSAVREAVPNYWPYLTAVAVAAWLFTTLAWWRGRRVLEPAVQNSARADPQAVNVKNARAAVHAACASRDPKKLRDALLQWAVWNWRAAPPRNIIDLAARVSDETLRQFLLRLEREGYAAQAEPLDIKAMSAAIVTWVDTAAVKEKKRGDEKGLRALYPR
ncbi:MAG: protein BatD [Gammaproteobacteria bacterium]|nr:protein BatD [Gammaproteobacteria bacterium]